MGWGRKQMTMQFAFTAVPSGEEILRRGTEVIRAEANALNVLAERLDQDFVDACELIMGASGRVVITGMGKSGHIGRKWAATMAATGTPAIYVHPGEASHGDLGMLVPGDILVVISNSGNTGELRCFLRYAASINVPVIGVGAQKNSVVMQNARVKLCYPAVREACPVNVAPTTSTTLQLALGAALALTLMDMRGFSVESMKRLHPGGTLGLRLTSVRDIMHADRLPLVREDAPMQDVVVLMTSAGFGIAGVVDVAGRLAGVITDGDLRDRARARSSPTRALLSPRASRFRNCHPGALRVDKVSRQTASPPQGRGWHREKPDPAQLGVCAGGARLRGRLGRDGRRADRCGGEPVRRQGRDDLAQLPQRNRALRRRRAAAA